MFGFSKKRDQQIEEDIRAAQLEEALFRAKMGQSSAKPDGLTADEIAGVATREYVAADVSPLEALKAKMARKEETAGPLPPQNDDSAFFSVSVTAPTEPEDIPMIPFVIPGVTPETRQTPSSFEDDLFGDTIPAANAPLPVSKPVAQAVNGSPAPSVDTPVPAGDEPIQLSALTDVREPYPVVAEEPVDPTQKLPFPGDARESVLQTCMPFILDGTDGQDPLLQKPVYELESVEQILGIEETEPAEPTPAEEGATIEFGQLKTEPAPRHTVISDIDPLTSDEAEKDLFATKPVSVTILPNGASMSREFRLPRDTVRTKEEPPALFREEKEETAEAYHPKREYTGPNDVKPLRRWLLSARRAAFLQSVCGIIALLLVLLTLLPGPAGSFVHPNPGSAILLIAMVLFSCLAAFHAFGTLAGLSTPFTKTDVCLLWPLLLTVTSLVVCLATGQAGRSVYPAVALLCVTACTYALTRYGTVKTVYSNWRLIVGEREKNAVALLNDANVTYGMAHRAIEGDVLVAFGRRTSFIEGFVQRSCGEKDLYGKARLWWIVQTVITVLGGLCVGLYHLDLYSGLIAAAVLACLSAPPLVFSANHLPLRSARRRLAKHHAMITGLDAACAIDRANAVVLSSYQLFPKGTVTLHNLEVLSQNELEQTLAEATAITKMVQSPLYPLFQKAMETGDSLTLPVADSIKYEESLGLTGWVGDNRVFIGSRKLLEAHEVDLPPLEVDHQILSNGFFPVYLARDNHACALLSVRYTANATIARQLRKLTGDGITVLINNCDPYIGERMVIDYFDLYDHSVSVMNATGANLYKSASGDMPRVKAGAAYKGRVTGLLAIMQSAGRIRRSVLLLCVMAALTAVLGVVLFAYRLLIGGAHFLTDNHLLWFEWAATLLTLLFYTFTKP